MADDGYTAWYQAKLWQLLPAVYRTLDNGVSPDGNGPLRELLDRIGAQTAIVRRSIDRLWDNQSIETCDDWAIPYIGDLLATRLVSCLDSRAQRLDVAKTIYYRRRSGTLGLLEELAADIAGRDARAVEFFRRLGRTRHQFDPPIGLVPAFDTAAVAVPAVVEGLVGATSRTPTGGFADLRNAYGAANSAKAFDEFAHTADLRAGGQSSGWYDIPHLGVFIWWLQSFPIVAATPVSNGQSPPCFSFDPTGREMQVFAPGSRTSASFGESWVSPDEWQLPVPVRDVLWQAFAAHLYGSACWVGLRGGNAPAQMPSSAVRVHPERGLFSFVVPPPQGTIVAGYNFGFMSQIGAGGFDERILESLPVVGETVAVSGGSGLSAALASLTATATVQITDSQTYAGPAAAWALPAAKVALRATNRQRPVIRWTGAGPHTWSIAGQGGSLQLQGAWLQGADIVLTGRFDSVRLRLATLDPGDAGSGGPLFASAIDGAALVPTTLWVEANIGSLVVERCITGPIRTRNGGAVEQITITDSILQAIPTHLPVTTAPILDPADLAARWKLAGDATTMQIRASLPQATRDALTAYVPGTVPTAVLIQDMQTALAGLDRTKMEAAYPLALADLALGTSSGAVSLARCTVLGRITVHRLDASECILDDVTTVEDAQHGCVRFSAYARGSVLHAPYRSVAMPARGPLFLSRRFGAPNFARLSRQADAAMLSPQAGDSILAGAQNGAEMGAFSGEGIALKKRGLVLKFEEYAPLGVYPVWIDAD